MFVHVFGAYFGIACARMLYSDDIHRNAHKEGSVYHSDLFSMIGELYSNLHVGKYTLRKFEVCSRGEGGSGL